MSRVLESMIAEIDERGPMTVARFMELALYDPAHGYYAQAAQRSGRRGDFFTSVDVGPLFGACLARLVAAAWGALGEPAPFSVVEAGAGNGRLARDVLDALASVSPSCYDRVAVTLVERSPAARAAQADTLGPHVDRLAASTDTLPGCCGGLIFANELLDAFPVHRVHMTDRGLVELYVSAEGGQLVLREGPLSTDRLARYLEDLAVTLPTGAEADVSLAAIDWCAHAAGSLAHGYLLLVDYGHDAPRLFGGGRATGTLRAHARHLVDAPVEGSGTPAWLQRPGEQDLTAHVDFTSVERALVREGLVRVASVDQARFLLALGLADLLTGAQGRSLGDTRTRLAARTLVSPESLGGSHSALLMATPDAPPLEFAFEEPWRNT